MNFDLVAERPWESPSFQTPPVLERARSMLNYWEKRMLYWVTLHAYEAEGLILDQGAFLGSSALCFAAALRNRGFASPLIHSYDLFRLGPFELQRHFPDDAPPGNVTRPMFEANLAGYRDLVEVHEGDILCQRWPGDPIEILFVDVAKTSRIWDHVVAEFFPSLIPERSLVVLQDYLFHESGAWHHAVMEKLAQHFEPFADTHANSVLFIYLGGLDGSVVAGARWDSIPPEERLALMDAAIARLDTDEKRSILARTRQSLADEASRSAA